MERRDSWSKEVHLLVNKNPFNALINEIQGISKETQRLNNNLYLGRVVTGLPNLQIRTHNIIIDRDNILIDKWLVDRHNILTDTTTGEHSHTACEDGGGSGAGEHIHTSDSYVDILKENDRVVMLRVGDTFCVISKVVGL